FGDRRARAIASRRLNADLDFCCTGGLYDAGYGNQIGGRRINRFIVLRGHDRPYPHAQILHSQDFAVCAEEPIKTLWESCSNCGPNDSLTAERSRYTWRVWYLDSVSFDRKPIDDFVLTIGLIPFFQLPRSR
ncbi:MAG: hypothetical protein WA713_09110, partial [Candidatus Acidiferrales bacterium]